MQLGELQNQIARFERRNTSIIALSVDGPTDSAAMVQRLGLTFALGSDPQQHIVNAFRVQNPDTQELALHAVYIVDQAGEVFYRKVARRRPTSDELIDAIDAHLGVYPQTDSAAPSQRIDVAYPQNNFQALVEIAAAERLPERVATSDATAVLDLMRARQIDDAMIAFKRLCTANASAPTEDLLRTSAWLIRQLMFASNADAIAAGNRLRERLDRVAELTGVHAAAASADDQDAALHALAGARARLAAARADITNQASQWQLRFAKTHLRSYREVALAARRAM